MPSAYERNVFINCPFDTEYHRLLCPLAFTVLYLGLNPKLAFESADAGEVRLNKIRRLIRESRFGIHDLSRCRAAEMGEYFRFNMPFELGLDAGCRHFGSRAMKRKRFLILEGKEYSYRRSVSDLAGVDLKTHLNDPIRIIEAARNWLVQEARGQPRPPAEIESRFDEFMWQNRTRLRTEGFTERDINRRPMNEIIGDMRRWIRQNPARARSSGPEWTPENLLGLVRLKESRAGRR